MTIHEIILHRDYRKFAAWCHESGRQLNPATYPWRFMGVSDEKFLSMPLRRNRGDDLIEGEEKLAHLAVIRAHERLVEGYWDEWIESQQIHGPAAATVPPAADEEEKAGWLF